MFWGMLRILAEFPLFALDRNLREPGKTESLSPRRRQVDDAAANKRAAIVDRHHYGASIAAIGDSNLGSERK